MQISALGPDGRHATRLLAPPDLRALQRLFEAATDYFEIATGAPPAADEAPRAFVAGPPGKHVDEKRVIGIFAGDALVGVLDAVTDWPEPGVWTMGILLLAPDHRGRGVGSAVLEAYERWARNQGGREFRTALVRHHEPGIRFLEGHGYERNPAETAGSPGESTPPVVYFSKTA